MSIAKDIVNGLCCEECTMPFFRAHGYPCVCSDCWSYLTPLERKNKKKANPQNEVKK